MAVTTTIWNPSGHPVHQLIQVLDVVVAASTVFRTEIHRLDYVLRQDHVEFPAPGEAAHARFRQLVSEHRAIWAELFVRDNFGAGEVSRQLNNEVTAYFVQGGHHAILSTVSQIHDVLALVSADPPLAEFESSIDACPSVPRNRRLREARNALVAALGQLGETIPRDIDQRVRRRVDSYPLGIDALPPHAEILSWATDARHVPLPTLDDAVPPTDPASAVAADGPRMPLSWRRAHAQYEYATQQTPDQKATLRAAYDWLTDHAEETLPKFATWAAYIRAAKKVFRRHEGGTRPAKSATRSIISPGDV